jgi:predicted regulator of Ras-like GTPase activity (Roadblock/LC7/MglB family)
MMSVGEEVKSMKYVVDELKMIPGVIGACFVQADIGVTAANLPVFFKKERLELIGNSLTKLYAAGTTTLDYFACLSLSFDESVIVARAVGSDTLCFVLCDPAYNLNPLIMSLDLLQEEFSDHSSREG